MNRTGRGGANCHVCSIRPAVGVWRDPMGRTLRACGEYQCVVGYTHDHPLRVSHKHGPVQTEAIA